MLAIWLSIETVWEKTFWSCIVRFFLTIFFLSNAEWLNHWSSCLCLVVLSIKEPVPISCILEFLRRRVLNTTRLCMHKCSNIEFWMQTIFREHFYKGTDFDAIHLCSCYTNKKNRLVSHITWSISNFMAGVWPMKWKIPVVKKHFHNRIASQESSKSLVHQCLQRQKRERELSLLKQRWNYFSICRGSVFRRLMGNVVDTSCLLFI